PKQAIEHNGKQAAGFAIAVPAERLANRFRVSAVLTGKRKNDRTIAGVGVGCGVAFVVIQKQFADATISVAANRAGIFEPSEFDLEGFGQAAIREAQAGTHGAPLQLSSTVRSDSCSALFTTSQRFHATGSISFFISCLTQSRRSFGS